MFYYEISSNLCPQWRVTPWKWDLPECVRLFQKCLNLLCPALESTALLTVLTQAQAPRRRDGIGLQLLRQSGGRGEGCEQLGEKCLLLPWRASPSAAAELPLPLRTRGQVPGTLLSGKAEGRKNAKVKLGIRKILCWTVVFLPCSSTL